MKNPHLMTASDIAGKLRTFSHPWNVRSEMRGAQLGGALGLTRLAVNFIRIAPGKEAYTPHAHHREEEWIYILEGVGVALVGEVEVKVGPGDFLAYPAPQIVHHLKNGGRVDLVCLMGGEQLALDVVDFPKQKKRMVWIDGQARAYPAGAGDNPFAKRPAAKKMRRPAAKK